ncbi:unnamed protein product [Gongylonema pulchrum]|uniref:DUF927 domain-containing protein n=1 Tax=Gongylonema pulchrum TaxID=637853 RepID=A0A183DM94_9BILA|nr:unnamed protein product [Gongylonema pulchrum]
MTANSEWIHDDVNGVWAYEHSADKILAMLFADAHRKDTGTLILTIKTKKGIAQEDHTFAELVSTCGKDYLQIIQAIASASCRSHCFCNLILACHQCRRLSTPDCEWRFNGKLCFHPITLYYSGKECAEVRLSCVGGKLKARGEIVRNGRIGTFQLVPPDAESQLHDVLPVLLKCSRNGSWTGIVWKQKMTYEKIRIDQIYCN